MLLLVTVSAVACGDDPCDRLCTRAGRRLRSCMADWPAGWEDLDATNQRGWVDACQKQWSEVRSNLEPRELDDALEQCEEADDALASLTADDDDCDVLRTLYMWE